MTSLPFKLDPFQEKALEWIDQNTSLFISAPTGSGKTVVAEAAIDKTLELGKSVIYTAPIKALSNQKYRDFRIRYGEEKVGILTGDVSLNPEAPVLIMTTEIYRNSLFENSDRILNTGWVIFDEVHYLDDIERGTVWEEALLFTPPDIRILALSATVPNVQQIVDWIRSIHGRPIEIVQESSRPVPLHFLFQCQGRVMGTLKQLKQEGYMNREDWRISPRQRRQGFCPMRVRPNRIETLVEELIREKKLPAIYFAFGRKRTEYLAGEIAKYDFLTPAEHEEIKEKYKKLLEQYDLTEEPTATQLGYLIEQGIAYHHAGMLPTLKEVVEQLFTSKLIKLIFTTETFALGINMPARTVLFDGLEKFYGTHFATLTNRDFYQMAGRAGRRGMDTEGFVYVRLQPHDISYHNLERMIHGRPEGIQSQFNATYATLLNLYKDLGPKLMEIYPRSFHYFQSSSRGRKEGEAMIRNKMDLLREMGYIRDSGLTGKGEFAASIFGYELLLSEMHEAHILEELDESGLNVLLSGLIFEPRKGDHPPRLNGRNEKIRKTMEHFFHQIHRKEAKFRVHPYSKPPHFNLAEAVEAWTRGADFDRLFKLTDADEGTLVRYLRMIIQLLREIQHAPHTPQKLLETAHKARQLINRGVVDAEKQLRN